MPPRAKQSNVDLFARELVGHVRSEADKRILQKVKQAELGLCLSNSPLRIQVGRQMIRPLILEADEVVVLPFLPIAQGQTCMMIRSAEDVVLALPIISGVDLAETPAFTGTTAGGAGTDPNSTVVQSEPSVGGPAGERVIAKALSYVGTKESPGGSNGNGGKINEWQDAWGMGRGPWCGAFADAMYKEAGVNDNGIGSPSTAQIYATANSANKVKPTPVKGCFAVHNPGEHGHVTLYIDGPMSAANCVGGNQSDSVSKVTYNFTEGGWHFCVPDAILVDANASTAAPGNGASTPASTRPAQPIGKVT